MKSAMGRLRTLSGVGMEAQWGPEAEPVVGGQGATPLKLKAL